MKIKLNHIIIFLLLCFINITAQSTLEWVREYRGDFPIQQARGIVADDSGNVYVGVTSFDTLNYYGMTLIKYSNEGNLRWIRKYEGPQSNGRCNDKLQAITIDDNNNIYITGASEYLRADTSSLSYVSFITIKYNPQGEEQWLAKYKIDSLGYGWYFPYTIAVDKNENVYVGGNFDKSIMLKYNSRGELLWDRNIDSMETVNKIILDDSANIYIANSDLSILKYDTDGNLIWKSQTDSLKEIKVHFAYFNLDEKGNIYVTGTYLPTSTNRVILTVKYGSNGNYKWMKKYGKQSSYFMYYAAGCNIDSSGYIYISGYFFNENNSDSKFLLIRYDSLGFEKFVKEYNAPGGTWIELLNTGKDLTDNIFLLGRETNFNSSFGDLIFVKFDTDGNVLYAEKYSKLDRNEELPYITYNKKNDIYILCNSYSSKDQIILTLKYTQNPVGIKDKEKSLPLKPVLHQNYPNPFNPTTTIKYQIPAFSKQTNVASDFSLSNVELKIYDILGKEVATLVNKKQKPGNYQIKFDAENLPSGVYYYQLNAGEYSNTKKMILIR